MKKITALLLVLSLMLCGCGNLIPARTTLPPEPDPRLAAFTESETTEPPTEAETEPPPVYYNPLNGEILKEPFNNRIYAISINNMREALPHTNVTNADMYFETFVNGSVIRGFALYTHPEYYDVIGPVRSNRLMFNDIVLHYDCINVHAGGSWQVVQDCRDRPIDNFNIDAWGVIDYTSFRDKERSRSGYSWEHCLYAIGSGLVNYANMQGIRNTFNPDLDYHMTFADHGTPENGVDANEITVTITMGSYKKDTTMVYDYGWDKYFYNQYGKQMVDALTGFPEAFTNVLILEGSLYYQDTFQRLKWDEGGDGWFACGGKAIPIKWGADDEMSPPWFTTLDGEPIVFGRGNTYVAITQTDSKITGIGDTPSV